MHIVTQDEIKSGAARPKKEGMLTWRFVAHNVRDAVWAAAPDYMWDASSWQGHMAYAYYRPSAIEPWKDAADMARMSIMEYSERWFPYPYPQISAVEGPISGMEYPMLAMEDRNPDKYALYNVVTHEIGHQWYPMIVGSNERMHMWQDEGFNTFINYFSEARRYPEKGSYEQRVANDRRVVEAYMQHNVDIPLEVQPDRIDPRLLGENAYVKTAVGLAQLRDEVLGPAAFDEGFREYTRRWAFKHPEPGRFLQDDGERERKRRLDWFFRQWFLENPHFDIRDRPGRAEAGRRRRLRAGLLRQSRARRAADSRAIHVQRRLHAGIRLPGRGVEHGRDELRPHLRLQGKEAHQGRARPRQADRRHRPDEQRLAEIGRTNVGLPLFRQLDPAMVGP